MYNQSINSIGLFVLILVVSLISCKKDEGFASDKTRLFAGGETTIFTSNSFSYSTPASNLTASNFDQHIDGDAAFEQAFVTAPTETNEGLGPVFNNNSCIACHPKDGRAGHPTELNDFTGLFLRASVFGTDEHGGPNPVPGFGGQIAQNAVYGTEAEAEFSVYYIESSVSFADGTSASLRKPVYSISNPYIPFPSDAMLSPRVGPPVFGLGLLEAISESDLLANVDEADGDNDGISGKANYVWNHKTQRLEIGRFGWKAINSTVLQQCAGAYNDDMGITNPYFPNESSLGQTNNTDLNTNDPELSQQDLDDVTFYCRTLAVPAPRNIDNENVIRGEELFGVLDCVKCHIPKHETSTFVGIPEISNQTIYPYTDLLLHDMGFGLADDRPSFKANGLEWKTRPLWGIGLTNLINGHTNFLHDGRARNMTEAILWHGGEAANSTSKFKELSKDDRDNLLAFLNSL